MTAMIKAYTDLAQSKKLAEILPHETADNTHERVVISGCNLGIPEEKQYVHRDMPFVYFSGVGVPCWSLAALLDVIPNSIYDNTDEFSQLEFSKRSVAYHDLNDGIKIGSFKDNLIDACYDIIIKLHEQKLL